MTTTSAIHCVSVDEARRDIFSHTAPLARFEEISISEAVGRICADAVESDVAVPAYTNSAMDGFAFAFDAGEDVTTLVLVGESLAGHPFAGTVPAKSAVRITTGARLPDGCDTVIPYEKTTSDGHTVTFSTQAVKAGANVRHRGESIAPGDIVMTAGTRITPTHAALLANLGIARLSVFARVRVAVIATGDELIEPGNPCPDNHLYNANSTALTALAKALDAEVIDFGILPDRADVIKETFLRAADECDLILTSGGAAASQTDFTHQVFEAYGQLQPWCINMRPGKPMRFGLLSEKPVFLLPGNPVAAFVTFLEFARGAILHLGGLEEGACLPATLPVILGQDVKKKMGRIEFMRARLEIRQGQLVAFPLKDQGSAALTNLTDSNILLVLAADKDFFSAGTVIDGQPLNSLLH